MGGKEERRWSQDGAEVSEPGVNRRQSVFVVIGERKRRRATSSQEGCQGKTGFQLSQA